MKKIAPFYLLPLLIVCVAFLQSSQIDEKLKHKLSDFNLKGKVKIIHEELICNRPSKDSLGRIQDCANTFSEQKFNPAGLETFLGGPVKQFKTDTPFELLPVITFQYSSVGDTLTETFNLTNQRIWNCFLFDSRGRIMSEIDSNYVINVSKVKNYKDWDLNFLFKYVYSSNSILKYQYRRDTLVTYSLSGCNQAGDIIWRKEYYANSFLELTTEYSYDRRHRLIKEVDTNNDLKIYCGAQNAL